MPGKKPVKPLPKVRAPVPTLGEHIIEVISDSSIAAAMGNGIWTEEIIPAEIQPPARSTAGASGIRVRIGSGDVTNGGDAVDLVVAFNEKVLLRRMDQLAPGCVVLLESKWRDDPDRAIAESYTQASSELESRYRVFEIPIEAECLKHVAYARRGKNMFVMGLLCGIYDMDPELARAQVATTFAKKPESVIVTNQRLLEAGREWAKEHLDLRFRIPAPEAQEPRLVVNGNTALALGVMASGMEVCAMYPITPATSASHYLSEAFERVGGMVHQAEDEIRSLRVPAIR
jgi:2-oxoglutarate ferredoxin oxidoreductase subunit alpha